MKTDEQALLISQKQDLFLFEGFLQKNNIDISLLDEVIPGIVHVNKIEDVSIQFLNKKGCEMYEHDFEEIKSKGNEIFTQFTHPDTIEFEFPKFADFLEKEDEYSVGSVFQQVRFYNREEYDWVFTAFKKLKGTDCWIGLSHLVGEMGAMGRQFEQLLDDNQFLRKNFEKVASLTRREKEILGLIAQGNTNKQIGEILFISKNTVRTHRNHIWKKLDIRHLVDAIKIAVNFGLNR